MDTQKRSLRTKTLYKREQGKGSKTRRKASDKALDGSEEVSMLKDLMKIEKLSHPSTDDERPIPEKKAVRGGPPSLVNIEYPTALVLKQIMPQLMKYLGLRDMQNCRQTCKSILEGIDSQLTTNLELPSVDANTRYKIEPSLFMNCRLHTGATGPFLLEGISILDKVAAETFLSQMEGHPDNPFVSRSVRFGNYGSSSNVAGYWDSVIELLKLFGYHIWHVELSDGHEHITDHLQCYKLVQKCLSYMPNLKSLELSFELSEIPNEHSQLELICHIKSFPLPALEVLEKLEWNDLKLSNPVAVALFSAYGERLRATAITSKVFLDESNATLFRNVWGLYLTKVPGSEILLSLSACELPNLRRLYLDLGGERCVSCGDVSNEVWSVKSILNLVKQFGLETISVFMAPGSQLRGNRTLDVNEWTMPTLKLLEIQHYPDTNYEFLKCFPNLEHIHFFDIHHPIFPKRVLRKDPDKTVKSPEPSTSSKQESQFSDKIVIDQFLYSGQMYDSAVWFHIPSLRWVTFKCVWDRDGKNLIAVYDWYKRELYEVHRQRMAGVVTKILDYVNSWFSIT